MEKERIYNILLNKKSVRTHRLSGVGANKEELGFQVKIYNKTDDRTEKVFTFLQPWEAREQKKQLEKDLAILDKKRFEQKYNIKTD